jgi:hypothetical protein
LDKRVARSQACKFTWVDNAEVNRIRLVCIEHVSSDSPVPIVLIRINRAWPTAACTAAAAVADGVVVGGSSTGFSTLSRLQLGGIATAAAAAAAFTATCFAHV